MSARKEAAHPHLAAESEPQACEKILLANSQGPIMTFVSLGYFCPQGPLPPSGNIDDVCATVLSSVHLLAILWTVAFQVSLSMGFPKQEYWSGLPFPSSGNLPNSGIKPKSPMSAYIAGRRFTG